MQADSFILTTQKRATAEDFAAVDMTIDQMIGERVRALRKARKRTLRQVAEEMGISYVYLGEMERGDKPWKAERIAQIAELFNVSPSLLSNPAIPLERVSQISEILDKLSALTPEKLEAVSQLLEAMRS